jgi:hypothetical protein
MGAGAMAPKPPVNPLDLVMKKAGNSLGDTIAQQLNEAAQMGVPYEHLLAQLAKLSGNPAVGAGQQAGEAAYGVMNSGGQPPVGGNQPGGQPPQPPPPPPPMGVGVPQQQQSDPNQVSSNQLTPNQLANSPVGQTQSWAGFQGGMPQQAPTMNPWKPMELLPAKGMFSGAGMENGNIRQSGFFGGIGGLSTGDMLTAQGKLAEINTAGQTMAGAVPAQEKDRMTLAGTLATNNLSRAGKAIEAEKGVINQYDANSKDYKIRTEEFNIALGLLGEDFDLEKTNPSDFAKRVKNMSSADQFALVYSFVKMSDPNAVKEGEFKAVENGSMSKAEAMKLWGGRVGVGDLNRMTDSAVTRLYQTSRKRYLADTQAQKSRRDKATKQLKRYREELGMPVDENVLTDYSLASIRKGRGQASAPTGARKIGKYMVSEV